MTKTFSWIQEFKNTLQNLKGFKHISHALNIYPLAGYELEVAGRWINNFQDTTDLRTIRVALLSGFASQPLANAVRVAALKEGYFAQIYEAPFGAIRPEIFALDSSIYGFQPELVLLDPGVSTLQHLPTQPLEDADVTKALEAELADMQALWQTISERLDVPVIQHTVVTPAEAYAGIAERTASWSQLSFINAFNSLLISHGPAFVRWLDVDALAKTVGLASWHDPRLTHHAKYGFATKCLPDYTHWLGAALRNALAIAPKALIVDLDNTLWGGVIGDDGLEGIRLGPDSAEGSAHQAFCRYMKALGQRGIILGICSKNDLANAREVFDKHQHMPLSLEDIAVMRCNWENKAANLLEIASELNIDASAMVFVDDNPAECELVRQQLPQIRVVQLDGDPSSFIRRLDTLCLFHTQSFSHEDLGRSKSYRARARSEELKRESVDLVGYLKSLEMRGKIEHATEAHLPRLTQMEMKTNQFNLSTRRLPLEKIQAMAQSANHVVLAVSLADRFTDHGLVAYLSAEFDDDELRITDWLMSCRVFSRTLEEFTFNYLIDIAENRNIKTISLTYVPTKKNQLMLRTFKSLTLQCKGEEPEGPWVYNIGIDPIPMSYVNL